MTTVPLPSVSQSVSGLNLFVKKELSGQSLRNAAVCTLPGSISTNVCRFVFGRCQQRSPRGSCAVEGGVIIAGQLYGVEL